MFYYQRQQTEAVPLGYHNLELTCRPLEAGEPYLQYILSKRLPEQPLQSFIFQEYIPQGRGYASPITYYLFGCVSMQLLSGAETCFSSNAQN